MGFRKWSDMSSCEKLLLACIFLAPALLLASLLSGCDDGLDPDQSPNGSCIAACMALDVHQAGCGLEQTVTTYTTCPEHCMEDCNLDAVWWCFIHYGCDMTDNERVECLHDYTCYDD